jgi:hypothetical protein
VRISAIRVAILWVLGMVGVAGSGQGQDRSEALPPEICDSLRRVVSRQGDSLLSVKASKWRPDSTNRDLIEAVRQADVVIQIRIDTLGVADPRTFRAVKWKQMDYVNVARNQVSNFGRMPYEPYAGCPVAYVLTLPISFSAPIRVPHQGPCSIYLPCP